jgi:hypothetical protein
MTAAAAASLPLDIGVTRSGPGIALAQYYFTCTLSLLHLHIIGFPHCTLIAEIGIGRGLGGVWKRLSRLQRAGWLR